MCGQNPIYQQGFRLKSRQSNDLEYFIYQCSTINVEWSRSVGVLAFQTFEATKEASKTGKPHPFGMRLP